MGILVETILTRPPKVTGLSRSSITGTSVTLNWNAIGGETGATYTVEEWHGVSGGGWIAEQTGITNNSTSITGLTSESSYQYRVKATNASGDGEESDSITITTLDVTAPSFTADAWQKSTDGSTWTTVDSNNSALIKGGEYVRFNFQSDNSDVSLSGNAVLLASDDSGSSFDTVETTSTLNNPNGGEYYVQFQIAENETENGYLRISFTLTDTAGNTTAPSPPPTNTNFILDTTIPSLNSGDANWYYSTDSGSTYTELNGEVGSQILGPGDKIKAYIYPSDTGGSDIHNLDVTCPGVTLGSSTISNSGTGETGNPSVDDTTDEDGNDTWELVYTIPALGSNSNANGYFGFNVTLEDEAGNQSSTTNMTPPTTGLTITVDTVAPALESGGTPSLDPAVQTNGTDIKLYFTESLQTAANAGALDTGFSIMVLL